MVADSRHSGEGRDIGGNSTIWIPAFAGKTLEDFSKTDSLNLGLIQMRFITDTPKFYFLKIFGL
jgi:hypothetical protein